MKLLIISSLFAMSAAASLTDFNTCSYNEICINIRDCPMYKKYTNQSFKSWPSDVQNMAKNNVCNKESVNQLTVISVCCPSVLNHQSCGGLPDDRIANGPAAELFDYPWMVLLYSRSSQRFVCGGTLISPRYVLTAAHCVGSSAQIVSVRVGEHDLTKDIDCDEAYCADPPQDIGVQDIIRHPEHSDRTRKNDIALIKLKQPATMGDRVRTICLPNGTPGQRKADPRILVVTGWGLTENGTSFDVLRYARVPPVSLIDCEQRMSKLDAKVKLDQSQICAGGVYKVDSCAGDSGGPLQYMFKFNGIWHYIQSGIVSYGRITCDNQAAPGVYTNVLYYLSWILQNVDE